MSTSLKSASRTVIVAMVAAAFFASGCSSGGGDSLGASFTATPTAPTPRLVKLVQKSKSNTHVVVEAVIYGPDTTLDMYSFAFDVKIGNPNIVRFVDNSAVAGNALQAFAGQTISAVASLGTLVGGGVDNSTVVVGVSKLGGGVGNGIAGSSAAVVDLTFAVQTQGTTTLTFTGSPLPEVLDQNGVPIATITFDSGQATIQGVNTGGGGY
jgi:hypothetical protein